MAEAAARRKAEEEELEQRTKRKRTIWGRMYLRYLDKKVSQSLPPLSVSRRGGFRERALPARLLFLQKVEDGWEEMGQRVSKGGWDEEGRHAQHFLCGMYGRRG